MTSSLPSKGQANLQLALWNRQAESIKSEDLYIRIQELGLPEEVVSMLHDLILKVQKVSGKVIQIGKIILIRLLEFVEKHFCLVTGMSAGAWLGIALGTLITGIPFVGPILTPIAQLLGWAITATGAVAGHNMDKAIPDLGKSLADIAREFFAFFQEVLKVVFQHSFSPSSSIA